MIQILSRTPVIRRDRVLAGFGVASLFLLAAAFVWAHHWGPRADSIVAGWAASTLVAGVGGYRDAMRLRQDVTRLTMLAVALAAISVVAFLFVGTAAALGADPTGSCGGG
jgi:hypothetical protein